MGKFVDLTGQKFGTIIADKYLGGSKWECHCEKRNNTFVKRSTSGTTVNICGGDVILHDIKAMLDEMGFKSTFHRRREENLDNNTLFIQGGKREQKRFLDLLYANATVYLDRKYEKYLQF